MRWVAKALFQRIADLTPGGEHVYRAIQRKVGRIPVDPMLTFEVGSEIASWFGHSLEGRRVLEVGTGHIPNMPLVMYLLGAREVLTFDLYRRVETRLLGRTLDIIRARRGDVVRLLSAAAPARDIERRIDALPRGHDLIGGLDRLGIRYMAPADAARTGLAAESVDLHLSLSVLEHIPESVNRAILAEAHRILAPDGAVIHWIDLGDHYYRDQPGLPRINFLKFSDFRWAFFAGSQWGYTNRLRASDFRKIFEEADLEIVREHRGVDEASVQAIEDGFEVAPRFRDRSAEDLCCVDLRVMARKELRTTEIQPAT